MISCNLHTGPGAVNAGEAHMYDTITLPQACDHTEAHVSRTVGAGKRRLTSVFSFFISQKPLIFNTEGNRKGSKQVLRSLVLRPS